jgi:penicillin-binding protein 1A
VSTVHPPQRANVRTVARRLTIGSLFVLVAALGAASGVLLAYSDDLPEISALDSYRPNTITRVVAANGEVVGEFATERRVVVRYDEIAPVLRHAIVATEDAEFEQHVGLSMSRILVTAVKDVFTGQRAGASTITQQLARNLFLQRRYMRGGVYERRGWPGLERKVKEAILALQIERRFTKQEILALYANQVPLHVAYGVEAGARVYFNKSARDVTVSEAATLAAIIQTPARLSPFVNPDRTRTRRNNYVLPRMVAEGYITEEQARKAMAEPVVTATGPRPDVTRAAYFVEDVRQELEARFGAAAIYETGLRVATTLDAAWQRDAELALDRGLRRIDKRRGRYRRPTENVRDAKTPRPSPPPGPLRPGDVVRGVVTRVGDGKVPSLVRVGDRDIELPRSALTWTGRTLAKDLFSVGDIVEVGLTAVRDGVPTAVTLEQAPVIQGAVVALDNRNGEIRVLVGGQNFAKSKFNRATQARRQVGSLFKPIVYATALEQGLTAASTFVDAPVSYEAGPNQPPYRPLNYDRTFEGPVTLRRALEQSRNIPAVKAMDTAGPEAVVASAKRLGLSGPLQPYLSLALGAAESTLLEMTSAYSAFAHQGVRMEPYAVRSVTDRDGGLLFEAKPQPHEAMKADTAYLLAFLLRGVVERGTAQAAQSLEWPFAGKTGTMDEYTDAWFVGFDGDVAVGVWVGYDEKRSLGYGETGASAALPIWMDVMRGYLARRRGPAPTITPPSNIVFVTLPNGQTEAFISGTQPEGSVVRAEEGLPFADDTP